jgi:nickel-dependent lactate racemase
MAKLSFPYGKGFIDFDVPGKNLRMVLRPNEVPALKDLGRSISEAIRNPIGTKRLREIVRKGDRVAIVMNDITRPVPNDQILPFVLEDLAESGIQERDTVVIIANGVHRANTPDEVREMVGESLFGSLEIHNHDAFDQSMVTTMGKTTEGIPISLNTHVARAVRRILIGSITPHHGAGYTGGRKSIFPGVSSYETLKMLHDVEPVKPRLGELNGNSLHKNALEAARVVGVDFIINTIPNGDGETCAVVAGQMEKAWERGIAYCDQVCRRYVPQEADIVITCPGGFPRDIDLRQSQKAISVAEMLVRQNGVIILVSKCSDGVGRQDLYELLKEAGSPQKMIENFRKIGFTPSSRKAYMFARAMLNAHIMVVTDGINPDRLRKMMLEPAQSVEEALELSFRRIGRDAKIVAIPRADHLIPVLNKS